MIIVTSFINERLCSKSNITRRGDEKIKQLEVIDILLIIISLLVVLIEFADI